jgi:Adenylate and Guanylate cyclase catalytic domain
MNNTRSKRIGSRSLDSLAYSGVPNPDEKHALTMVRFAQDIMSRMNILVQAQLASALGEDTLKLQLRVGIHSGESSQVIVGWGKGQLHAVLLIPILYFSSCPGSVTAGVLRGDRARFQVRTHTKQWLR